MRFNTKYWEKITDEDFENAWLRGKEVLSKREINKKFPRNSFKIGKEHPLFETIEKLRKAYLSLGFDEVVNPLIVDESHVKRQFGKEALAILDRCFYLATLPKPNVGISNEKVKEIKKILKREDFNLEDLRRIFHAYKKGKLVGDDIIFEISKTLEVDDSIALNILDLFPEFKNLVPEPSNLTLRSHMTTGWFITLEKVIKKLPKPIKLFSIDRCFRREQGEDAKRLYTYFSASCVIADDDVGVDDGKAVAEALLRQFGFEEFKFIPDEKRSKYYIPETQTEVYVYNKRMKEWIELATFGIYSPTALSKYDIDIPVMNLGLGVERLAMTIYGYNDVRELVYPQMYNKIELSDFEIARNIKVKETPNTPVGLKIAESIIRVAEEKKDVIGPCIFKAFKGELYSKSFSVYIFEKEKTKLCGPATFNEIVVFNGNILGIPKNEEWKGVFEKSVKTGIRYIDSFAYLCGKKVENGVAEGKNGEIRIRVVESPSDINLEVDESVKNYISSSGGKIDVRGPMFISVKWEIDK